MKLEIKNLSKKFKNNLVIDNISVTFQSGKIYGLIGRNGSGKSVFLKMICSFYIPTNGSIKLDNYDYINNNSFPKNTRALIENPNFISSLTGYENLKMLAQIQNKISDNDIYDAMKKTNIFDEKDKKVSQYSLGMKQKLGIAQVIMENPDILILDEPFNGLDEETVVKIKKILKQERANGKLIIITSHIKEDIIELSDEIYKLDSGKLFKYEKQ